MSLHASVAQLVTRYKVPGMTSLTALRRACRRRKEKLTCAKVQKALAAETGGDGSYDALTALRFLPCNSQCKQAVVRRPFRPHPTSLLTFRRVHPCLQLFISQCSPSERLRPYARAQSLLPRRSAARPVPSIPCQRLQHRS